MTQPNTIGEGGVPSFTDCGDDGCTECDVCRYLDFMEWAGSVGKPDGSTVERNTAMDAYLARTYPHAFPNPPASPTDSPYPGRDHSTSPLTSSGDMG